MVVIFGGGVGRWDRKLPGDGIRTTFNSGRLFLLDHWFPLRELRTRLRSGHSQSDGP